MRHRFGFSWAKVALCLVGLACGSMPARAAVWTVNALGEPASVTSASCTAATCTLRDAVNAAGSGDVIRFDPALDGQTIYLTLATNDTSTGSKEFGASAFFITGGKTLSIDAVVGLKRGITIARDPALIVFGEQAITEANAFRLFDVGSGSTLHLSGLTLRNGFAMGHGSGEGGGSLGAGGAVFNQGTLTMDRCTVSDNVAFGGFYINANNAPNPEGYGGAGAGADGTQAGAGGGPNAGPPGGFVGTNGGFGGGGGAGFGFSGSLAGGTGGWGGGGGGTSLTGNDHGAPNANGRGGFGGGSGINGVGAGFGGSGPSGAAMGAAIFNDAGNVSLTNTTLSGNHASGGGSGLGGAIFNYDGNLTLVYVTLSGNIVSAGAGGTGGVADGGAIYSLGDTQCTQGGNSCLNGSASLDMEDSIAANSIGSANDVVVTAINGGTATAFSVRPNNLIPHQSGFASGVLSSADPKLDATPSANRGFGYTLYPLPGSPAIAAVQCLSPGSDQRGFMRPQTGNCTVGAVEVPSTAPAPLIVNGVDEPAFVDSAACNGTQCPSLRDAVNFALPGDTIQFSGAIDGQTIMLTEFSNALGCGTTTANGCLYNLGALGTEFGPSAFFIPRGRTLSIDALTGLSYGIQLQRDTASSTAFRFFDVGVNAGLNLSGLRLNGGLAYGWGSSSGGSSLGAGGAIFNQGQLALNRCTLDGNSALGGFAFRGTFLGSGGGGGVGQDGKYGGGGPNGAASYVDVYGVFVGLNGGFGGGGTVGIGPSAGVGGFGGGGAADFLGASPGVGGFGGGGGSAATGTGASGGFGGGSGLDANVSGGAGAGMGGAIFNDAGTVTATNTTFAYNSATGGDDTPGDTTTVGSGYGGAIFNYAGAVTLNFVTMYQNSTAAGNATGGGQEGGAIYSLGDTQCAAGGNTCAGGSAALKINNSLIGQNSLIFPTSKYHDIYVNTINVGSASSLIYAGGNIVEYGVLAGNATSSGPAPNNGFYQNLSPLQDNGGGIPTLAPIDPGYAVDTAPNCLDANLNPVTTDQRGVSRPVASACDLGAVEALAFAQSINFPNPGPLVFSPAGTFALTASSSGGLPVAYASITPNVCSVTGSTATILAAGTCSITATQPGNARFSAATPVTIDIAIQQAPQAIAFTSTATDTSAGAIYPVTATGGGSGNPVTFTVSGSCVISGSTVTFTGTGSCTINANQAGDANYLAAPTVQQTVGTGAAVCTVNSNVDDPSDASAKVVSVDVANWVGPNAGSITLRDCILAANLMTGATGQPTGADGLPAATAQTLPALTIRFAANLSGATIVLGTELPLIFNNLSIDASTLAQPLTIDGGNGGANAGNGHRIFFVSGLPSTNPLTFLNGIPDPDGAQPILVTFENLVLQNAQARGGCSGGGGGGMGAGGALFVNRLAQVGLTNVSFVANTARGGDSSGMTAAGGSGGGGMGSRSTGGAGGGLGVIGGGDGQDCHLALAGADGENGHGIGTWGINFGGGGFGGNGVGQISAAQNFSLTFFGGGAAQTAGVGDPGRIGGGGHRGNPRLAGFGGYGGGGGDGEGPVSSANRGGDGGFGGGGGYGVGSGGNGGFGGGGGDAGGMSGGGSGTGGRGGFGAGGGAGGSYSPGLQFVAGGYGGGRGYVTGGGGAGFGGAVFVRDGGMLLVQNAGGAQSLSGGQAIAGAASNGFSGTPTESGYGTASGAGIFLHGGAGITFDVAQGATTTLADGIGSDCGGGNLNGSANTCSDGGLMKAGAGKLVVGAVNGYDGTTIIAAGSLQLDGSLISGTASSPIPTTPPSPVTIDGGTLAGSGIAAGSITLTSGSIAPGDATPGTLTTGPLTWSAGATMRFRLGATDGGSDRLSVNGSLAKSGSGAFLIRIDQGVGTPVPGHTYVLIGSANAAGFSAGDFTLDANSVVQGSFAIVANQVQFTVAPLGDLIFANGFE